MSDIKRIGLVSSLVGSKRPVVYILQDMLKTIGYELNSDGAVGTTTEFIFKAEQSKLGFSKPDGDWGGGTWTKFLEKYSDVEFNIDPIRLVHEMIAYPETSSRNAYGFGENDIGDGAGANYGVLQHNRLGSMKILLKMAGKNHLYTIYCNTNQYKPDPTIKEWFNSPDGRYWQNEYFKQIIWDRSVNQINLINLKFTDPLLNLRLLGLYCDTQTQNGTMYSSNIGPIAKPDSSINSELYTGTSWDYIFGNYCTFKELKDVWTQFFNQKTIDFSSYGSNKQEKDSKIMTETNIATINYLVNTAIPEDKPELKLEIIGQYRARTSNYFYFKDVLSRRNIYAKGKGYMHGDYIDLEQDYSISLIKNFDF